jgi:dihydropteroate synthase
MQKTTQNLPKYSLNLHGHLMPLDTPKVMGILNITEDSFYDGGRYLDERAMAARVRTIIEECADFIDVGAQSSRPGAPDIPVELEKERIEAAVSLIKKIHPTACISIDTYRAKVAQAGIEAGAHIINDVSGGLLDKGMLSTVASLQVPYILMHYRGNASTMQSLTQYQHLIHDTVKELLQRKKEAQKAGISDIIIDPGFGFAKNLDQNYVLLKNLDYFKCIESPLLVGISRKSMIYRHLNVEPSDALNGTTFIHAFVLAGGAHILRVHDVAEAVQCVKLFQKLQNS